MEYYKIMSLKYPIVGLVLFFIQNSIAKYPHLRLQELTLKHL